MRRTIYLENLQQADVLKDHGFKPDHIGQIRRLLASHGEYTFLDVNHVETTVKITQKTKTRKAER